MAREVKPETKVAKHFLSATGKEFNASSIAINRNIAKRLMKEYTEEELHVGIDLYKDKMYSLNFLDAVMPEVREAIKAEESKRITDELLANIKSEQGAYKELNANESNNNKCKLERRSKGSWKRTQYPNGLFKQQ